MPFPWYTLRSKGARDDDKNVFLYVDDGDREYNPHPARFGSGSTRAGQTEPVMRSDSHRVIHGRVDKPGQSDKQAGRFTELEVTTKFLENKCRAGSNHVKQLELQINDLQSESARLDADNKSLQTELEETRQTRDNRHREVKNLRLTKMKLLKEVTAWQSHTKNLHSQHEIRAADDKAKIKSLKEWHVEQNDQLLVKYATLQKEMLRCKGHLRLRKRRQMQHSTILRDY